MVRLFDRSIEAGVGFSFNCGICVLSLCAALFGEWLACGARSEARSISFNQKYLCCFCDADGFVFVGNLYFPVPFDNLNAR